MLLWSCVYAFKIFTQAKIFLTKSKIFTRTYVYTLCVYIKCNFYILMFHAKNVLKYYVCTCSAVCISVIYNVKYYNSISFNIYLKLYAQPESGLSECFRLRKN